LEKINFSEVKEFLKEYEKIPNLSGFIRNEIFKILEKEKLNEEGFEKIKRLILGLSSFSMYTRKELMELVFKRFKIDTLEDFKKLYSDENV
jgi:hypothetical protein